MYSPNGEVANISTELRDISLKIQQLQERRNIMCIFQEIRNRTNLGQTEEAYAKLQQINIIENELKRLRERQAELQKRFESISAVTYRDDQKVTAAAPPRQKFEDAVSPSRQEFEAAAALLRQKLEAAAAPPKQKLEAAAAPPSQELEAAAAPPRQELEAAASPSRQEFEAAAALLRQKLEAAASPPRQKLEAAATPPRQEFETAAAPPRQEFETAAAPIRQEVERKVPEKKVFFVEAPPTYPAPSVILEPEKLPPEPSRTQCPQCQQFVMTETISSISSVTWLVCLMTALLGCVAGCCLIPFCTKRFKSITHRCPRCRTSITTLKKL